ncbi:hypothetical protein E2C01_094214 [Portunus trituberculatus]|uniref:Uncharacterized protein n=1 Tax=Portunus trituberculatus TaxID=210409 RepID=A0A5B7JVK1_PORTR|nr:hypothetical protein [Portunus trituberculatus]
MSSQHVSLSFSPLLSPPGVCGAREEVWERMKSRWRLEDNAQSLHYLNLLGSGSNDEGSASSLRPLNIILVGKESV